MPHLLTSEHTGRACRHTRSVYTIQYPNHIYTLNPFGTIQSSKHRGPSNPNIFILFLFFLRVYVSKGSAYLVLRVSIDNGICAPFHSSLLREFLHSSLSLVFLCSHERHSTTSTLPTSCALLHLLNLLHRNQRQPLQPHQTVSPQTPIG